jgi:hypothetical protein
MTRASLYCDVAFAAPVEGRRFNEAEVPSITTSGIEVRLAAGLESEGTF